MNHSHIERRQLYQLLQDDGLAIARDAALTMHPRVRQMWPECSGSYVNGSTDGSVAENGASVSLDERLELAFRQLSTLFAFSLLVDEPAMLIDDDTWIRRVIPAPYRGSATDEEWLTLMIECYLQACRGRLADVELSMAHTLGERAVELYRTKRGAETGQTAP